jgi:hypothetical protein
LDFADKGLLFFTGVDVHPIMTLGSQFSVVEYDPSAHKSWPCTADPCDASRSGDLPVSMPGPFLLSDLSAASTDARFQFFPMKRDAKKTTEYSTCILTSHATLIKCGQKGKCYPRRR